MGDAAAGINKAAADGSVDYDNLRSFATAGSLWLESLGYGPDLLSMG